MKKMQLDKKGLIMRNYLLILLGVATIFGIAAAMINEMNNSYDINASSNFSSTYDYTRQINSTTKSVQEGLETFNERNLLGQLGILISVVVTAGLLVIKSIPFGTGIMTSLSVALGIPSWLLSIGIIALITMIIFIILGAWHRYEV